METKQNHRFSRFRLTFTSANRQWITLIISRTAPSDNITKRKKIDLFFSLFDKFTFLNCSCRFLHPNYLYCTHWYFNFFQCIRSEKPPETRGKSTLLQWSTRISVFRPKRKVFTFRFRPPKVKAEYGRNSRKVSWSIFGK